MKIERFEDIEAWQLARELTRKVYRLTKKTRFTKDYGLKRQIQDAVGSSWLYQLPGEIRRAKDLNNREPLNREPNNLCRYPE